jgi:hypothetical protein
MRQKPTPRATKTCNAVGGPGSSKNATRRLASPATNKTTDGADHGVEVPRLRALCSIRRNAAKRSAAIVGVRRNLSATVGAPLGVTEESNLLSFTPNAPVAQHSVVAVRGNHTGVSKR